MVNLIGMRSVEYPTNALIDTSGMSNALLKYGQVQREQEQQTYDRQQAQEQRAYSRGRDAKADQRQQAQDFANLAAAIDKLPPQDPRRSIWTNKIKQHPEYGKLDPMYSDPVKGPSLVAAEWGKFNQEDSKTYEVNGRLISVGPGGQTREIYSAPEKADPVRDMLMRRLGGGSQQPQPAPSVQSQSFTPMGQRGPRLQNIADVQQPPPGMPEPTQDMVDTPYGRMSKNEARELGGTMLLDPKYAAAGRAILDTLNAPSSGGLGKAGENAIDEKAINMVDLAGRLDGIMSSYRPEFQTYETAFKMAMTKGLDSFEATRKNIPPEDAKMLSEFTKFKQNATNNLSEYIKYVTGAAMGVQEEGRIRKGMPDPQNDSPREFEAKARNTIAQTKLALARYTYLKRNGYNDQTISALAKSDKLGAVQSIEDMQGIINQKLNSEAQIFKQSNPQADDNALRQHLKNVQKQEFGI